MACRTVAVELTGGARCAAQVTAAEACGICLEPPALGARSTTPCGHSFCSDCVLQWLEQRPSCPLCKAAVATLFVRRRLDGTLLGERQVTHTSPTPQSHLWCSAPTPATVQARPAPAANGRAGAGRGTGGAAAACSVAADCGEASAPHSPQPPMATSARHLTGQGRPRRLRTSRPRRRGSSARRTPGTTAVRALVPSLFTPSFCSCACPWSPLAGWVRGHRLGVSGRL